MHFAWVAALVVSASGDPPPYSPPWQLRPLAPARTVRLDTSATLFAAPAGPAVSLVELVSGTVALGNWVPFMRVGIIRYRDPKLDAAAVTDPVFGLNRVFLVAPFRFGLSLAAALPTGTGGGDAPEPGAKAAIGSGALARMGMDNAVFGVNDLSIAPGVSAAWVDHGLTVQLEATVIQYWRVRGAKAQPDADKTNLTSGLLVGWFPVPELSLSAELHYQRFLSTPAAVKNDPTGDLRDALSVTGGLRLHLKLAGLTLRPGLAYARGLDQPMWSKRYQMLQLDLIAAL